MITMRPTSMRGAPLSRTGWSRGLPPVLGESDGRARAAGGDPGPARAVRHAFEPGLVEMMLADLGSEPGRLLLLEHALLELWDRRDRGLLTLSAYRETGRVDGAIAQRADQVYEGLSEGDRASVRRMMLRLTQPGEGRKTRAVASRGGSCSPSGRDHLYVSSNRPRSAKAGPANGPSLVSSLPVVWLIVGSAPRLLTPLPGAVPKEAGGSAAR